MFPFSKIINIKSSDLNDHKNIHILQYENISINFIQPNTKK